MLDQLQSGLCLCPAPCGVLDQLQSGLCFCLALCGVLDQLRSGLCLCPAPCGALDQLRSGLCLCPAPCSVVLQMAIASPFSSKQATPKKSCRKIGGFWASERRKRFFSRQKDPLQLLFFRPAPCGVLDQLRSGLCLCPAPCGALDQLRSGLCLCPAPCGVLEQLRSGLCLWSCSLRCAGSAAVWPALLPPPLFVDHIFKAPNGGRKSF